MSTTTSSERRRRPRRRHRPREVLVGKSSGTSSAAKSSGDPRDGSRARTGPVSGRRRVVDRVVGLHRFDPQRALELLDDVGAGHERAERRQLVDASRGRASRGTPGSCRTCTALPGPGIAAHLVARSRAPASVRMTPSTLTPRIDAIWAREIGCLYATMARVSSAADDIRADCPSSTKRST